MRAPLARRRVLWAWLCLLPALAATAAIGLWPLARTVALSFTDAGLDPADGQSWVGLANYATVLDDPAWWQAVGNTAVFTAASVALELVLGLGFALLLAGRVRGRALLLAVAIVPWAVPTVVSARLWGWMYHDVYGVINDILFSLGLILKPVAWLADPATALGAVVFTDVWKSTPFVTLILYAGLQAVPGDLVDAARIDGAGPVRAFWHVVLPLLKPAIAVALIFRTLDALRVFDLIYVMTSNSPSTASVSVYARRELVDFQDAGVGGAASALIFLLLAVASVLYVAALRPATEVAR